MPAVASVTVRMDSETTIFSNDGDPGYYIKSGNDSSRVMGNSVFSTPVGADGLPRWKACTKQPCAKVPTPQSAPGLSGTTSSRSLTKAEKSFLKQEFPAATGMEDSDMKTEDDSMEAVSTELKALEKGIKQTINRLRSVAPGDNLDQAYRPMEKALPAARSKNNSNAMVETVESSIELRQSMENLNGARTRTSATMAGMSMVSCNVIKTGVSNFNRIAGETAVVYTEQKAPLSLLGLNSCVSDDSAELSMLDYIREQLEDSISEN